METKLVRREDVARAICCGEHGRCILEGCEPEPGEQTACVALKYHDKTIAAVFALIPAAYRELIAPPSADEQAYLDRIEQAAKGFDPTAVVGGPSQQDQRTDKP